jgi:hypothetical protein
VNLKRSGEPKTGQVNPLKTTKDSIRVSTKTLRKKDRGLMMRALPVEKQESKITGIDEEEI